MQRHGFPKKTLRERVRDDAKRSREQEPLAEWLQDNLSFEHGQRLREEDRRKVAELFDWLYQGVRINKREQKVIDLEILIANLLAGRQKPVAISLDERHWKTSPHRRASPSTINLVYKLQETGYIGMRKGFNFENKRRRTRIWATDKLLAYMPALPQQVIYEPVNLVELRDEKGNLIEYNPTDKTPLKIKPILERVNRVNAQADIRYHKYELSASLVAKFIRKFTLYGRLHTGGYRHHYQAFSGDERAEITINGDPVVELDFSGLHPHLLYAKEGIQLDQDPYAVIDPDATKENKALRNFYKDSLFALLYAQGKWAPKNPKKGQKQYWRTPETNAKSAINSLMYRDKHLLEARRKKGESITEKDKFKMDEAAEARQTLQKSEVHRAEQIIEAFKQAHRPIAHYFCAGKETGLRIMNRDAKIALDVVNHFAKQGKPILAIHDSFVVQEQYKDELYQVMDNAYRKYAWGFTCPID